MQIINQFRHFLLADCFLLLQFEFAELKLPQIEAESVLRIVHGDCETVQPEAETVSVLVA